MKRLLVGIALIVLLISSACAAAAIHAPSPSGPPNVFEAPPAAGAPALQLPGAQPLPFANDAAKSVSPNAVPGAAGNAAPPADRLVIETANLSIVVSDVNARAKAIQDMAKQMGGFVVSVNIEQTYIADGTQVPQAQVVVRVPVDQLDTALTQIKQGTVSVQNETRAGQDVTDQVVDLQSRLTAKQAAADQLLKIMQNATKTQDVLDVYQQLQQVQSDIEVLKGQIKYNEQSAALSAITVQIVAEATVKPLEVGGWKPQGVARDAIQNLIYFWQNFIDFLIQFFLYTLPVLLTIAIPLFLLYLILRWILRRTGKPKAKAEQSEEKKK